MTDKVKASFEYVIIETHARPAGTEIKSETGFIVGKLAQGEEAVSGKVVSIGPDVPDEYRQLLSGKTVALPHAHMANVPDPDWVAGIITKEEARLKQTKYVSVHYKSIQSIYEI